jgi:hypothetical protein
MQSPLDFSKGGTCSSPLHYLSGIFKRPVADLPGCQFH